MNWQPYRPGMQIAGKRIRISGSSGQYNEVQNNFDHRTCRVPAGLEGKCEFEIPQYAKLSFRRIDGANYNLWLQIAGLAEENINYGSLFCTMDPNRLRGIDIEA